MIKLMTKKYIILGPPGSGKGTQAKRLAKEKNLFYFGTGDLMRQEAETGTAMGLVFRKVWERGQGELIADELVQRFVGEKLEATDLSQGLVLDGYPRTMEQAEYLEEIFKKKKIDNLLVINLVVSTESLIKRMLKRRVDENRVEDRPEVLRKRIEVYQKQTAPLIEYYQKKGLLINIDGEPTIEEVWEEIKKVL